ncbi:brassinosteroid-responsive RING protein 1-like [Andrographis paniculata]|uniref:brassinosteroid-responsive RING protein 1-like n=1 Tax=Andrographis paniculata TaxID=175694 RepID=UPI0021E9646A|nr:brassinosteroid-responsive RING protein 1-like [Andrographis paniculata]
MGFLYLAIRIPSIVTASFFFNVVTRARFLLIGVLTHLGLYKPPPEEDPNSGDNSNDYILILDGSSPSLVPIPVRVVTAAIKSRVPVVQYRDLALLRGREECEEEELCGLKICSICLECIEWEHEVRELCNCDHVFHRGCLDTWMDEGQVTCPLCRSMLLPPKTNLTRCNGIRPGLLQDGAHLVAG